MTKQPRMLDLGPRIKSLRESRNMTQEDLAQKLGLSRAAIAQWETGVTKNITLAPLLLLAETFKMTVEEMLTGSLPAYIKEQAAAYGSTKDGDDVGALTPDEKALVVKYRRVSSSGRTHITAVLSAFDVQAIKQKNS